MPLRYAQRSRCTGPRATTCVACRTASTWPQFRTVVDDLAVHFLRSPNPTLPLVITHGWPGSVVEFLKVIGPLTDPPPTAATHPARSTWWPRRCGLRMVRQARSGPVGAFPG